MTEIFGGVLIFGTFMFFSSLNMNRGVFQKEFFGKYAFLSKSYKKWTFSVFMITSKLCILHESRPHMKFKEDKISYTLCLKSVSSDQWFSRENAQKWILEAKNSTKNENYDTVRRCNMKTDPFMQTFAINHIKDFIFI